MELNIDKNDSLSENLLNCNKKIRIYYNDEKFVDFTLYQSDNSEILFLKDVDKFKELKDLLSNDFFSFISDFSNDSYLSFL